MSDEQLNPRTEIGMEEAPDLGPCCNCGAIGDLVRNIITMPFTAPQPGTGWGCMQCGLPGNGAIVVLCDNCLESHQRGEFKIVTVCDGLAYEGKRIAIKDYQYQIFKHDLRRHEVM